MSAVIKAENLGKKYIISHQKQRYGETFRDAMTHAARGLWQRVRHPLLPNRESLDLEEFWALKDVNFEVRQGDRVGIIGRNGAGKSTLLKVLSRITEPTTGRVRIRGRVSSLLEVGTGFHPELTGRENIFLNGAILGMTRQEIKGRFDEIVAFAELEKFLDTPVKRYSSGMYVRLAFAVAAHLEPEILIVDEVLAVGDAEFQKKCLGKMEDVAKEGRTVLFVSHNMGAIQSLCQETMLLYEGEVLCRGGSRQVIERYISLFSPDKPEVLPDTFSVDSRLKLQRAAIENMKKEPKRCFRIDEDIFVYIEFQALTPVRGLAVGITLSTSTGQIVLSSYHGDKGVLRDLDFFETGVYKMCCKIPKLLLNELTYYLSVTFQIPGREILLHEEKLLSFKIERTVPKTGCGIRPGVVKPELTWHFETKLQSVGPRK
jgi:lipopolysaccharide transport system ATP-binding protein